MQLNKSLAGDPQQMARTLVRKNGLNGALKVAMQGAARANEQGNFYRLSVWRDVKRILRESVESAA